MRRTDLVVRRAALGVASGLLLVVSNPAAGQARSGGPPALRDPRYPIVVDDWPVRVDQRHRFFIDDELVARRAGVQRVIQKARKHPNNPLVRPDNPWEDDMVLLYGSVVRDARSGGFTMWYLGRNFEDRNPMRTVVCYATSTDGINWHKPKLGLVAYRGSTENNIVMANHGAGLDTIIVFADPHEADSRRRYKMFIYQLGTPAQREGLYLYVSADGIRWREQPGPILPGAVRFPKNADGQFRGDVLIDGIGDVTMVRFDAVLNRYVANLKSMVMGMRSRMLSESDDLVHWTRPRVILTPDERDGGTQLYGMVDFPYESLWLGVLQRYRAVTDLTLDLTWAVSRDGRHWSRVEPRDPFVPVGSPGAWDCGNISPANNPPIRVGDELWFYYGGRDAAHNTRPGIGAIGLATLPIDRFAALRADDAGTVTTRPLHFDPGALHVNVNAGSGALRVEVLDAAGQPLAGFGGDDCTPIREDTLDGTVRWGAGATVAAQGEAVRLRFILERAELYSFWIE